ncbi:hypothetical protein J2067_000722 [Erwinia rhapontici]|nr:hypothetical protein [Erwinia rhapontici]
MVKGVYPKLAKSCLFLQNFVAIVRKVQQTTEKNTVRDSGSGMPDPYENRTTVQPYNRKTVIVIVIVIVGARHASPDALSDASPK